MPEAEVLAAVNPKGEKPYEGPTGTVRGVVSIQGDPAPAQPDVLKQIPADPRCDRARDMYAKLFREGLVRSVADVLVTVTGYEGYVPAESEAVKVEANGCTWGARTIAVTFGQRLEIHAKDQAYLPRLAGARQHAVIVAIPGGTVTKVYPTKPIGPYQLVDEGKQWMAATVVALKYATFDVTGLDGKFEIGRIPVGEVRVSAFLPSIGKVVEKTVRIEEGKTLDLDLELNFDAAKDTPGKPPPPRPSKGPVIH